MPTPPVIDPVTSTPDPTRKVSYRAVKRRRYGRQGIHRARGFQRQLVQGRIPVTRPAKR